MKTKYSNMLKNIFVVTLLLLNAVIAEAQTASSLSCGVSSAQSLTANGYSGGNATSATGSCGQCCYQGSDLDNDGDADVNFSVENSKWYKYCNPSGTVATTIDFIVDETNNDCNLQGAAFVTSGTSSSGSTDALDIDCSNQEYAQFGSGVSGNADGFSFTGITIPPGGCAWVMVDGYGGATCSAFTVNVVCPPSCTVPASYTAGTDLAICEGTSGTLNSTVTGGSTSGAGLVYSWTPTTGLSCTTCADPVASPTGTTTYTMTACNGGTGFCCVTDQVVVTVTPNFTANAGTDITACAPSNVTIGGSPTGPAGSTYSWAETTTNANIAISGSSTVANPTVAISAGATGSAVYTVTVTNGSCVRTDAVTVTVGPLAVSAGAAQSVCNGSSVSIGGSPTAPAGSTYSWACTAGTACANLTLSSSTAANPTVTANASATGSATYTVTATLGTCTNTSTVVVTVNPLPTTPTATASVSPICAGASVTLTAAGGAGTGTYSWWTAATGGTQLGTANTLVVTPNATTTYYIQSTDATTGCISARGSVTVTVNSTPVANAGSDVTKCAGSIVNLSGTVTNPAACAPVQTWSVVSGTGTFGNANSLNTTFTPTSVGTIQLALTPCTSGGCTAIADNVTITVTAAPTTTASATSTTLCTGLINDLSGVVTGGSPIPPDTLYQTFSSSSGPFSIPDNNTSGVLVPVSVTGVSNSTLGSSVVSSVKVNVDHDRIGQVEVWLCPPGVTPVATAFTGCVQLFNNHGANSDDLTNTIFTDGSAVDIASGTAPYSSSYNLTGTNTLSGLSGNTNGTWNVVVLDNSNAGSTTGTAGQMSITLATPDPTTEPYTYSWSPSTGLSSSTELYPSLSTTGFAAPSTVTYILTATDENGCSDTGAVSINIIGPPTTNAGPNQTICGSSATLAATALGTGETGTWTVVSGSGTFTASGSPTSTVTALGSGNNDFLWTVTNSCGSASDQVQINSTAAGIVLSSAVGTNNQTVCNNAAITNITYTVSGGATGAGVTGLPAGVSGSFSGSTFTISGTPTATGTFNYTVTTTGCVITATGTITVNPNVTPTFTAVAPICSGATLSALPTTSNNSYTGTWSPALNNTATTTYTFTPTAGQCATTTTLTITVNPNATISLTSAAATTTQTPCVSTAITNITYSVGGGGTGAGATGLPAGVTGSYAAGVFTISGTPTATGTFNYTVTTTGTCTQTTATGTITVNPNVTPTFTAVAAICSGATLSALPTTSNNSYTGTWSPALNNTATTTYTFTPTAGQCATTTTLTITVNPNVTPTFTAVSPICSGATLSALPTTSNNSYTGTWSPALNNTATTTYTFTPTAGQCATTTTLTITVNSLPATPTASVTVQPTCTSSGTIVVTAPTGANIQYSIGGAYQASGTFSSLSAGTYNVTAQNTTTGCISNATTLVVNTPPGAPATPTASATIQPTCTTPTGTIVVTAPTGASIEYSSGGPYQASGTFSGLVPGNYNISAQDMSTGCISAFVTVTINAIPNPPAAPTASVPVQPTCTTPTGDIVVTAPTGASIQYSIGGAYQVSGTFSALTPGNYNVTAQDMNTGCISAITTLTVNPIPGGPAAPTASVTAQPTCTTPTGTIVATAPTGGSIQYSIGGAYQASGTFSALTPGSYNITAQDMSTGCISAITTLTVDPITNAPAAPTASVSTQPTCTTPTGTIVVTAPTGTSIQYSIGGAYQVSGTFSGLAPGNYNVTAQDMSSGCISSFTALTVDPVPAAPADPTASVTVQPTCVSSGTIVVTAPTGASIEYSIGAGYQTSGTFSSLTAGTYNITAQDVSTGCISNATVLVVNSPPGAPAAPTASVTVQPSCITPTGTIVATAPTGASIQYSIGGAYQASGTFSGLAPGNYNVTAQDMSSGCISSFTALTVDPVPAAPADPTASVTVQPTCVSSGTIVVTAPTGASIEYSIGAGYQTSGTFSSLTAGTYNVTAQDVSTGCISNATVLVVNSPPGAPAAPTASVTVQPSCITPTGTIVATAPTGASIQYSIGGAYQASGTFSGLAPGNYNVTAQDMSSGCISSFTAVTINAIPTAPSAPTASVTVQPTCATPTGTIVITAPTGASIEYSIGGAYQTSGTFSGLAAGNYNITAQDMSTGCISAVTTLTVDPAPNLPTATITSQTNVDCFGNTTGSATVSASGGAGSYTYSWSPSGGSGTVANNLSAGTYTITVSSAGCNDTAMVVITEPPVLSVSTTSTITSCGATDGTATATVTGGDNSYNYSWNSTPVQTNATATGLSPGSYTVSVTDGNGCSASSSVTVGSSTTLTVNIAGTLLICNGSSTTLTASAAGATSYTWNTVPSQSTAGITVSPSATTIYTVNATDGVTCNGSASVTVTVVNNPTVNISGNDIICRGQSTTLTASSNSTYLWSPGSETTQAITVSPFISSTYYVTVTNSNPAGCNTATDSVLVQVGGTDNSLNAGPDQTISLGATAVLTATGAGNAYSWSTNEATASISVAPTETTPYWVSATDDLGCRTTDTVIVNVEIICGDIFVPAAFSPNDDGVNDVECVYSNCLKYLYWAVYDRWGEKVFEGTDISSCWDGTYKGKLLNTDVFVYKLEAVLITGESVTQNGEITITK